MAIYVNNQLINIDDLAEELLSYYPNYYETVYWGFIKEAVSDTLDDWKLGTEFTIEDLHQHIKANYI